MDYDDDFVTYDEAGADSDAFSSPASCDDDDDLGIALEEEHGSSTRERRDGEEYHFEVLDSDEILHHMNETIKEVAGLTQLPLTTARILLNHFKWDKEKLLEMYYDCSDQENIFREAHVISPFKKCPAASSSKSSSVMGTSRSITSLNEMCQICMHSYDPTLMIGLECSHRFCMSCWITYLTTKIMDEGMGQTISCAAYKCDILVDDSIIMKVLKERKVKMRYQHLITNNFVECNRLLRWCPAPDCCNAIKVQYADSKPVTCKCSFTFCFACAHEWHDPVSCLLLTKWLKKCNDDSETSNWIAANTKECPKCHVTIEKDGGCNHMTCKNQCCKMEFCWVCLGPWEPHGSSWYSCNRYDDAAAKAARDAQEVDVISHVSHWTRSIVCVFFQRSRAALQRYLHYCNRYMNHMQSLKFENKLYVTVKCKMEEMQQHNMSWIEVQFLRKAVDVLCKCRRTLKYTYVFAYYLLRSNQSIIFEDNQQDLELATEQLSEFLERDLAKENLVTLKQKVQDKYRYCEGRRKVLLDHCHEGDEKDWWEFLDGSNVT
ncbi:unnamed protein product [Soboliphyme baturini]|uniref:RBR-type E3 ubiquitin transferase n=1 Tax=Soboliphyme baturini TaxID=241478 RepID=A0A183IF83_9BILA|nr:unnamed protein product [Soboliphyme baturini]